MSPYNDHWPKEKTFYYVIQDMKDLSYVVMSSRGMEFTGSFQNATIFEDPEQAVREAELQNTKFANSGRILRLYPIRFNRVAAL